MLLIFWDWILTKYYRFKLRKLSKLMEELTDNLEEIK